jgi:hypothetical protein
MSSSSANTVPPLLRLPVEPHDHITSYLEIDESREAEVIEDIGPALLNLHHTGKYFYALFPAPTLWYLLRLEQHLRARLGYACKHCVRLRPASTFADSMLRGNTRRNSFEPWRRFCADCGFDVEEKERYTPGTKVVVEGSTYRYITWGKF